MSVPPPDKSSKKGGGQAPAPKSTHMSPGDQAPPGTPGTGENICPACNGTGKKNGQDCPNCEGSGTIITGIGGA